MTTTRTELTFVKVVRYTQTITKEDFLMRDGVGFADREMTEEEKETLWQRVCRLADSYTGEVEPENEYDEEDKSICYEWTDPIVDDIIASETDDMEKK